MWEYILINDDNEEEIVFGYSYYDACARSNLNPDEWEVLVKSYID